LQLFDKKQNVKNKTKQQQQQWQIAAANEMNV
jgi:hypothetical protein